VRQATRYDRRLGLRFARNVNGVLAILLGWFALAGCNSRPHAPALDNTPVYQNDREGFRFMVPEGWSQGVRADVPEGKTEKERVLVVYRHPSASRVAVLEVTLADLPEATDLNTLLVEASHGVSHWRLIMGPESVEVNGPLARRWAFSGRAGKDEWVKEIVAIRRGERTYFFCGLFAPTDTTARDQVRRAVGSIIWR
jgi:hypothetical protein